MVAYTHVQRTATDAVALPLPVCKTGSAPAWEARRSLHCRFSQMPRESSEEQANALPVLLEKHATSVSSNYKEKMNHIS